MMKKKMETAKGDQNFIASTNCLNKLGQDSKNGLKSFLRALS